jgi:hypothetical protein
MSGAIPERTTSYFQKGRYENNKGEMMQWLTDPVTVPHDFTPRQPKKITGKVVPIRQPQADPVYLTCECGSQTMMIEPTRYVCSECGREQ